MKKSDKIGKPLVKYHRNGVEGIGFFTVRFTGPKGSDAAGRHLLFTRFCEEVQSDPNLFCGDPKRFYALVDLDSPETTWDAAYFLKSVDAAIEAACADASAFQ